MENASKALIIAGAILLAILIITLGIIVFGQAQDTIQSINMSEQEQLAFNNKFTPYEGEHVRGSQVNALAQAVFTNNQSAENNGETATKGITMSGAGINIQPGASTGSVTKVPSGSYYTVVFTYTQGLVRTITVTLNS